eukprot:scaffold676_cov115-Isochrysis_galbana.AAC.8
MPVGGLCGSDGSRPAATLQPRRSCAAPHLLAQLEQVGVRLLPPRRLERVDAALAAPAARREEGEIRPREERRDRLAGAVHAVHVGGVARDLHDGIVCAGEDRVQVGQLEPLQRQKQRHHARHRVVPVEEDGADVRDVQPAIDHLGSVAPGRDFALLLGEPQARTGDAAIQPLKRTERVEDQVGPVPQLTLGRSRRGAAGTERDCRRPASASSCARRARER